MHFSSSRCCGCCDGDDGGGDGDGNVFAAWEVFQSKSCCVFGFCAAVGAPLARRAAVGGGGRDAGEDSAPLSSRLYPTARVSRLALKSPFLSSFSSLALIWRECHLPLLSHVAHVPSRLEMPSLHVLSATFKGL